MGICHVCNLYKSHRRALQMLMTMFMFYSLNQHHLPYEFI